MASVVTRDRNWGGRVKGERRMEKRAWRATWHTPWAKILGHFPTSVTGKTSRHHGVISTIVNEHITLLTWPSSRRRPLGRSPSGWMSRVLRPPLHGFRSEACAITSHQQPTSRSASRDLSGDVGYQFVIWMKRRYRRLVLILFGSLAARTTPKFVRVTGFRCASAPFCTRRGAFSLDSFRPLDRYLA